MPIFYFFLACFPIRADYIRIIPPWCITKLFSASQIIAANQVHITGASVLPRNLGSVIELFRKVSDGK